VSCLAEVMWVAKLPHRSPAKYDVGLRFIQVHEQDRAALAGLLNEMGQN
jgi:hypothetical protein